jgi:hypothetical protein
MIQEEQLLDYEDDDGFDLLSSPDRDEDSSVKLFEDAEEAKEIEAYVGIVEPKEQVLKESVKETSSIELSAKFGRKRSITNSSNT